MPLTPNEKKVLADVKKILKDIENKPGFDYKNYNLLDDAEKALWERIHALDAAVGKGLQIGRLVQWPHADGYASYIVTGINKTQVSVAHVNLDDAWHSHVVYNGKVARGVAERSTR